jgi:dGTP triphosphohydrolase
MSKNQEDRSNKELDTPKNISKKEDLRKTENAIKSPTSHDQIKSLEDTITALHSEVDFASNAFTGNVNQVQELMDKTTKSLFEIENGLEGLLESYNNSSRELKNQIATLSLLPNKTQETLKKLAPEISQEVEKLHSQRMSKIELTLKDLQNDLSKKAKSHTKFLKDLSAQLQQQFTEEALKQQQLLKQVTVNNIEQMNKVQFQQSKKQEQTFQKFVEYTKKEIESVTSNHGTKFLRNTAICLILAAITGGISGWYINKYFPRFVGFSETGDVTVHHSNVKIWKAGKVENKDLHKEND